jgi:CheY-like chemotaxis protein
MTSAPPRVVFVEDDAAMHLYVQTAVQDLPIELACCNTVEQAWQTLLDLPPALLIADLMLGGESGLDLIERLRAGPSELRSTRVAVTSAATDAPGVRERLQTLGVWRSLQKPVGLGDIEACVRDAIEEQALPRASRRGPAAPTEGARDASLDAHRAAAIAELFGGDRPLYDRYREACQLQFPIDIAQGDAGLERSDLAQIRRLAHNLRSVLRTLGEADAADRADRLEAAAVSADLAKARAAWRGLRTELLRLTTSP